MSPRVCPECKRALGHRPGDCHLDVSRGGEIVGPCECRCRTGEVSLDASGFYWPYHDQRRVRENRPLPVFVAVGGHLVEPSHPKAIAQARADRERPRWPRRSRPSATTPPPVTPVEPLPIVTVPTRREQLVAENLAEMRKRRR